MLSRTVDCESNILHSHRDELLITKLSIHKYDEVAINDLQEKNKIKVGNHLKNEIFNMKYKMEIFLKVAKK